MSTNDLDAIISEWLQQCGACDAGLPMGCACSDKDYRPAMSSLVDEVEQLRAKVARVEGALDIRTRARAWMTHLGYEDHQIDAAEAWRQPREPWLHDDPPTAVVDLETAAGIAREYEEAIRAAMHEHKHLGPICECGDS